MTPSPKSSKQASHDKPSISTNIYINILKTAMIKVYIQSLNKSLDSSPSPSYHPHHCLITPVEPSYGVDLFEDDYLFLPAAYLRMGPALRPPVQSLRLRSLTSVTLFRFYVYGRIFDNPPGFFFYLHVE
jgi:hypothetical protein